MPPAGGESQEGERAQRRWGQDAEAFVVFAGVGERHAPRQKPAGVLFYGEVGVVLQRPGVRFFGAL